MIYFIIRKVGFHASQTVQSFINIVTFESLYSVWFHKKSSNEAIHALYVTSNKIVIKLFRYCSIMSVNGITNTLNTLFKRETGEKSVQSTYKASRKSYKKEREEKTSRYKVVLRRYKIFFFFSNVQVNTT